MKQTAVEWLIKEFNLESYQATCDFAKAMEREQIIEAFEHIDFNLDDGLHYYTETYESNT